jgi:hypothetical protein
LYVDRFPLTFNVYNRENTYINLEKILNKLSYKSSRKFIYLSIFICFEVLILRFVYNFATMSCHWLPMKMLITYEASPFNNWTIIHFNYHIGFSLFWLSQILNNAECNRLQVDGFRMSDHNLGNPLYVRLFRRICIHHYHWLSIFLLITTVGQPIGQYNSNFSMI